MRGRKRGRADDLLVLRSGDFPSQPVSVDRGGLRDVAVPQVPGLEQRVPPFLLVLRKHARETAEARRLNVAQVRQCTPRYRPPSIWITFPVR